MRPLYAAACKAASAVKDRRAAGSLASGAQGEERTPGRPFALDPRDDGGSTEVPSEPPVARAQALSFHPVLKIHHTAPRHKARKPRIAAMLMPTPTSETP